MSKIKFIASIIFVRVIYQVFFEYFHTTSLHQYDLALGLAYAPLFVIILELCVWLTAYIAAVLACQLRGWFQERFNIKNPVFVALIFLCFLCLCAFSGAIFWEGVSNVEFTLRTRNV